MRYIVTLLLILSAGCMTTNPWLTESKEPSPVYVDPETSGIIDRNNDGVVSTAEIDAVLNNPSTLTVFICLIFAVIIAVAITIIISKWTANDDKTDDTVDPQSPVRNPSKRETISLFKRKKASPVYVDKKISGEGVAGSTEANASNTTDIE